MGFEIRPCRFDATTLAEKTNEDKAEALLDEILAS
jgi:hypothetical protein